MEENSVQSSTQQLPQQEARLGSLPTNVQGKAIMRLWERMTQLYGHRFLSAWGPSVNDNGTITETADLWLQGLGKYSMEEIKIGITKLIEKGMEWPPTLPEFMHLCKPERLAPYHKMAKQLPPPEVDQAVAITELKKIRALINKRKAA